MTPGMEETLKGLIASGPMAVLLAYICLTLWKALREKEKELGKCQTECQAKLDAAHREHVDFLRSLTMSE